MEGYNTYSIESEVYIKGLGTCHHSHQQKFKSEVNVFGRVLEYHKYMYSTFPNCEFKLISAKLIED